MKERTLPALLCVAIAGLVVPGAAAQQSGLAEGTSQIVQQPSAQSTQDLRPIWVDTAVTPQDQSYLDFGISESYGRDSAVNNVPNVESQFNSAQGHVALALAGRRFSAALGHDATIVQFPGSSNIDLQQYHWTTLSLSDIASRRTTWGLAAANAYGADAARAASSVSLSSVTNVPIDNGTVQAGLVTGNVLRQYANFMLDHQATETRAFSFGANAGFHNFLGAAPSAQQYSINLAARQYFGPRLLAGIRADGTRQDFGTGKCTTAAVTGFSTIQLTEVLRADASAGPAFGSDQCTGSYQYQFILTAQSPRGNQVYVGTSRKRGNGAIAGSLWETSAYGGVQLGNPRQLTLAVNAGYTNYHGGTGPLFTAASDVSGYFVSAEYQRRLTQYLGWSFTARHFQRDDPTANLSRTVFFVTFTWSREHGGVYGR